MNHPVSSILCYGMGLHKKRRIAPFGQCGRLTSFKGYLPKERFSLPSRPAITCWASWFAQDWLATVQLVLQALWQELWHSPQPPCSSDSRRQGLETI